MTAQPTRISQFDDSKAHINQDQNEYEAMKNASSYSGSQGGPPQPKLNAKALKALNDLNASQGTSGRPI